MRLARLIFLISALTLATVPLAWSDATHLARPGSINYVEGQSSIGPQALTAGSIGTVELAKGQILTTQAGKVEILLTPGVFLRVADSSSVKMISPDLTNTEVELDKGRAIVEAIDVHKENNIRIDENGATVNIVKNGVYDFDADRGEVRVFSGEAHVYGNQDVKLGSKHMALIATGTPLKSQAFETRRYEDDFYRWSGLRSAYLSEASIDVARTYVATGPGWYGPGWVGWGWYWNPWFGAYTFLPADGVFWSPFGWGFYSPIFVYHSPYFYGVHQPHTFYDFHGPYGHGYGEPHMGIHR